MSEQPIDINRYKESQERAIVISLDLGKQQDFSCFMVSEILPEVREERTGARHTLKIVHVRDIQRLPLGTPYPDVANAIYDVFYDKQRLWLIDPKTKDSIHPSLLVDAGGVGESVCDDMERRLGLYFTRYNLVRGTAVTRKSRRKFAVPRTTMFQWLYAAFADNRIRINPKLKLAQTLLSELRDLRPEGDEETGYIRVVHREGQHDDLAITLASTNWWANRHRLRGTSLVSDQETVNRLMGYQAPKFA